jgi:hypothetical protein
MRNTLLFSVALLGLTGCLNVQKDPPVDLPRFRGVLSVWELGDLI